MEWAKFLISSGAAILFIAVLYFNISIYRLLTSSGQLKTVRACGVPTSIGVLRCLFKQIKPSTDSPIRGKLIGQCWWFGVGVITGLMMISTGCFYLV